MHGIQKYIDDNEISDLILNGSQITNFEERVLWKHDGSNDKIEFSFMAKSLYKLNKRYTDPELKIEYWHLYYLVQNQLIDWDQTFDIATIAKFTSSTMIHFGMSYTNKNMKYYIGIIRKICCSFPIEQITKIFWFASFDHFIVLFGDTFTHIRYDKDTDKCEIRLKKSQNYQTVPENDIGEFLRTII